MFKIGDFILFRGDNNHKGRIYNECGCGCGGFKVDWDNIVSRRLEDGAGYIYDIDLTKFEKDKSHPLTSIFK